jgi:carbon-monoxide dehydrogenase small subunit
MAETGVATSKVSASIPVTITINGKKHEVEVAPHRLLVEFLRDAVGLTGTKNGCETGQCGACTILLDGVSVKSCAILAAQMDGAEITTIEGLTHDGALTPLQSALWEKHGVQCGYCTPGLVLALTDLLNHNPNPAEPEILRQLDGVMCRCNVYPNAVRAVQSIAGQGK